MFFAVPYDHKYPLCTLVSKSNVTLAQPRRSKILLFFIWKSFPGDRCSYPYARKRILRSDVDGLTHEKQLLNLLCIVYMLRTLASTKVVFFIPVG